MPGDTTYIHLIDALAANGPLWLVAVVFSVIGTVITMKLIPIFRESKQGEIEIAKQREKRKAEEARMMHDRDRENATNSARMIDAVNRQSDSTQAMAAALDAITTRIDASQARSIHMGEVVDSMDERIGETNRIVKEIHAVTVKKPIF